MTAGPVTVMPDQPHKGLTLTEIKRNFSARFSRALLAAALTDDQRLVVLHTVWSGAAATIANFTNNPEAIGDTDAEFVMDAITSLDDDVVVAAYADQRKGVVAAAQAELTRRGLTLAPSPASIAARESSVSQILSTLPYRPHRAIQRLRKCNHVITGDVARKLLEAQQADSSVVQLCDSEPTAALTAVLNKRLIDGDGCTVLLPFVTLALQVRMISEFDVTDASIITASRNMSLSDQFVMLAACPGRTDLVIKVLTESRAAGKHLERDPASIDDNLARHDLPEDLAMLLVDQCGGDQLLMWASASAAVFRFDRVADAAVVRYGAWYQHISAQPAAVSARSNVMQPFCTSLSSGAVTALARRMYAQVILHIPDAAREALHNTSSAKARPGILAGVTGRLMADLTTAGQLHIALTLITDGASLYDAITAAKMLDEPAEAAVGT